MKGTHDFRVVMSEKRFLALTFLVFSVTAFSFGKRNKQVFDQDPFVVVLDAGHGGHDPGNLGNGYLEKNIALGIVLKVGALLEKEPGIKVVYTRKDDTFVDLFVRGEIANKANADLFVSVHCDSHTSNAHGAGTFVLGLHANKQNFEIAKKENSVIYLEDDYDTRYADYDINSPESVIGLTIMQEEFLDQSILLAKIMQEQFADKLKRNDRKVKQAGFIVLHQTFMPSVLVETGFLTNREEGAYLNSQKGQTQMGTAIARAILQYKSNIVANGLPAPSSNEPSVVVDQVAIEAVVQNTPNLQEGATLSSQDGPEAKGIRGTEVPRPEKQEEIPEPGDQEETASPLPKKKEPAVGVGPEAPKKPIGETNKAPAITEPEKPLAKIQFKVQLMASSKDLNPVPVNFNGLNRISKEPYQNLFRYLYGSTSFYREAKMLKSNADLKGYPTSFIVAYKDGERIPLKEALKLVGE